MRAITQCDGNNSVRRATGGTSSLGVSLFGGYVVVGGHRALPCRSYNTHLVSNADANQPYRTDGIANPAAVAVVRY